MNTQENILEELREMNSSLAGLPRTMPYFVPQGYFEIFPEILKEQLPVTNCLSTENPDMPFHVPTGYFQQLPQQLINTIHANEALNSLPRQLPYTITENYFADLPAMVLQKAKESGQKRKNIFPIAASWARSLRWAAVALLILGIAIGSYSHIELNRKPVSTNIPVHATEQALTKLPPGTIDEYIRQNIDDFDSDMLFGDATSDNYPQLPTQQLSDKDIEQYLNETGWN